MTITFPRALPDDRMVESTFGLDHGTKHARSEEGRRAIVSQTRVSLWQAQFQTTPLWLEERAIWQAWERTLAGGRNFFLAYDSSLPFPQAYREHGVLPNVGASPWDGVANVLAFPVGENSIQISGASPSFVFKVGDRVTLRQGDRYGYHEIAEAAVADATGDATLSLWPLIDKLFFTVAATAHFLKPLAKWQMVDGSFSSPTTVERTPVSFQAVQVVS